MRSVGSGAIKAPLVGLLGVLVIALGAPSAGAAPTCAEGPQTVGNEIIGTPCADTIRAPRNIAVVRGEGGDDVIYGQRGNDTLYGGEGNDRLYGGVGDDFLRGGPGDDRLSGGFGADSLDGEAGDDFDRGDATVDRIGDSGGGTDTLSFATGVTPGFPNQSTFLTEAGFPPDVGRGVYVDLGQNFANDGLAPSGGGVDEPLPPAANFANFEVVIGTPFDDYIVGTSGAETFYGGGGADFIEGGGGADVAYGGAEGDACVVPTAHECESTTKLTPRNQATTSAGLMGSPAGGVPALFFSGTSGKDEVTASYASGQVNFTDNGRSAGSFPVSEAPDSLLMAGLGGDDTLSATNLPESTSVVLLGGEGDDQLTSGATEDADIDGAGDDVVNAGGGDDAVPNNGGADRLEAGAGEDLFVDNAICDGDRLDGGPGRDNANWANFGTAVSLDLATGDGGLVGSGGSPSCPSGTLTTLVGLEDLEGTSLGDTMVGDAGENQLLGRLGADTLRSGDGNDTILANSGTPGTDADAVIDCGPGFDTAEIDQPAHGPDPAPSECEAVEEREPNSFRPPDTPTGTPDTELPPPPAVSEPAEPSGPPAQTPSPTPPPDTTAPQTRVAPGTSRRLFAGRDGRRRVEFRFSSDDPAATFLCRLDHRRRTRCTSPRAFTVAAGAHTFAVTAVDAAGNADPTPALIHFRVRRRSR